MLRVAVCDDNPQHRKEICHIIGNILFDNVEYTMDTYDDGEAVCQSVEDNSFRAELLFLDIGMRHMDGLQTARYLYEQEVLTEVVFLTRHEEFVFEGYQCHAYDYLLKPVSLKRMEATLNRYLDERKRRKKFLQVNVHGSSHKLWLKNILYFESDGRTVHTVCDNPVDEISFYMKLDEVAELLEGTDFVRVHQSYVINLRRVEEFSRTQVVMQNQAILPVSRKYKDRLRDYF